MGEFLTLSQYAEKIMANKNQPGVLSELQLEIAAKYAMLSDIAKDLQLEKAVFISSNKFAGDKAISDKAVEAKWLGTEGGKKEIKMRYELKALEKLMSSIKSSIVVSTTEARNMY